MGTEGMWGMRDGGYGRGDVGWGTRGTWKMRHRMGATEWGHGMGNMGDIWGNGMRDMGLWGMGDMEWRLRGCWVGSTEVGTKETWGT